MQENDPNNGALHQSEVAFFKENDRQCRFYNTAEKQINAPGGERCSELSRTVLVERDDHQVAE